MKPTMTIIGFLAILLISKNCFGQDSLLSYYIKVALAGNPAIQASLADYQASREEVSLQDGWSDPAFSMGIFTEPMMIMSGKEIMTLQLSQQFSWFGTHTWRRKSYLSLAASQFQRFNAIRCHTVRLVEEGWYSLITLKERILIENRNLQLLEQIIAIVQVTIQTDSGKSFPEFIELEIERNKQHIIIETQQQKLASQQISFNTLLNRSPLTPILFADSLTLNPQSDTLEPDSILLEQQNPTLLGYRYEQQFHAQLARSVRRNGLPKLGLGIQYMIVNKSRSAEHLGSMNGRDMVMPMISLSLPIYRKKYTGAVRSQQQLQAAAEQRYQNEWNNIRANYATIVAQRNSIFENLSGLTQQVNLLNRLLKLQLKEFSAGQRPLSDILSTYRSLTDYQLQTLTSKYNYCILTAQQKELLGIYILPNANPISNMSKKIE